MVRSPVLLEMIASQPDALAGIARRDVAAQAELLAGAERVFVVGTGSSHHAAELGALMLAAAGLDSRAITSAGLVAGGARPRSDDAAVVISHTGETAYALRARRDLLAHGVPVVSITGVGAGWPEAVETVDRERTETYTVSYLAALAVLVRLAETLDPTVFGGRSLPDVAVAVRAALAEEPDDVAFPARLAAFVGHGPWSVTAREGALKVREAARMLAEGYEAEAFLHGMAVPMSAADTLVLVHPDGDPDGFVAALGRAAEAEGLAVTSVADSSGLPPLLAQFPMTVRLQRVAAGWARARATDPDVVITGAWADQRLWALGTG